MSMRSFVLVPLAALALAPVPALARDRATEGSELVRQMQDPRTQDAVGTALGSLVSALLGMKAEPFVRAMESMGDRDAARRIPKGATLGDLAGPDARHLPKQIKRRVPGMMNATGSMVGALEAMAPQLEAIGKQLERDLEKAD